MKTFSRLISRLLIMSMVLLPFSTRAGMIGTDQVVASATAQAHRDQVRDFVGRADVQKQMEIFGLSAANAKDRVDALTEEEVQRIAGRLDSAPAGASTAGVAWTTAFVILLAIVAYLYWK